MVEKRREGLAQVTDVSKNLKGKQLVQNISFQIHSGQTVALCGGNGAGKSTVLRMIVGIMRPTLGDIVVNSLRPWAERKSYAEQVGYMPDDFQFNQGLSAQETLQFWADLKRVSFTRVDDVLATVGLDTHRKQRVTTFSKGMRQRLLLAQSLLAKPALLVLDEPTNGLDPFWMRELVQLLKEFKREGQMIIFSTHQLEIAEEVADEVVFMNEGKNVGTGPTATFREQFGSLYHAFHHSLGMK
ncbi:ABC transporter ATP-binding protein [Paenibacillus illinoisensis]|uniref:ABC transporter family protein n=1 Tax=Paenibacillus illinoisensis TaxID=59845 RepID=A0A2W0CN92_9BACL|nr:ABC transporter ATP-binding protein [Paenibacillus illinoisensis]PYY29655.1 ABC transporter family protein [Paenibacillus illinoisensis]